MLVELGWQAIQYSLNIGNIIAWISCEPRGLGRNYGSIQEPRPAEFHVNPKSLFQQYPYSTSLVRLLG